MRRLDDIEKELRKARSNPDLYSEDEGVSSAVEQTIARLKEEKLTHPEFIRGIQEQEHARSERLLRMWA